MRVVIIGGSGHIGSHLVPRLVRAGHDVVSISRGTQTPYVDVPEWDDVQRVTLDRERADADGSLGDAVLAHRPDAVVDMVCFTPASATALVDALRGRVAHLVHCGSIWRYGPSRKVPIREEEGSPAEGEYGIGKAAIARLLQQETAAGGLVTTSVDPGHIVGPGWKPIGALGNLDPDVWHRLSAGAPLAVPDGGTQLMHHVHADDVAQVFERALERRDAAAGEAFSAVAPSALSARGLAQIAAGWFGKEASLRPVSWEEFRALTPADHADASWEHLHRNHCFSIDKARRVLGYEPRYEPEEAVLESVRRLISDGDLAVATPLQV
ncbi:NAD-dependent epimerase/dehydratase family protein [Microbacterium sp. zg-Y818]|uniref:NAD-dependent epimerase/dehydratase family protein n=1 Tax=unclassified Microbacterium TaxID=2609290 RepID=UPI00214C53F5|nr:MULTISPECIES: NAD-dependent epimerase/dehydratase family protein [unclassified Microbacterium]MCR2800467.1 NAD-dependent epimerase/dehydratase family protein [Microbacterium sp. zg.Y818]WIM22424.1 NAD-dependent epimerase/dehydratase family protein [Microbacterium sp. zg-Y818]